jgi:hypothetical protein
MDRPAHPSAVDDDESAEPAAMLALLRDEQQRIDRRMAAGVPAILLSWGLAWLVGFGVLWAAAAEVISLPVPVAVGITLALMVVALALSAILGARMGRGIRTSTSAAWTGTVYGLTWPAGLIGIFLIGLALRVQGLPAALQTLYDSSAIVVFVGIMYLVAGAIWHTWQAAAMGAWLVVVGGVAPFFGSPTHFLVFALAGGGVFLLGALYTGVWASGRRRTEWRGEAPVGSGATP